MFFLMKGLHNSCAIYDFSLSRKKTPAYKPIEQLTFVPGKQYIVTIDAKDEESFVPRLKELGFSCVARTRLSSTWLYATNNEIKVDED